MIKVMIDAGHYGKYNQSPVVPEYWESDMTWKLQNYLIKALEKYEGVVADRTRENQENDLNLNSRGKKSAGYDLFISLHSNASSSENTDRVDIYAPLDGRNNSHEFARKSIEVISDLMDVDCGSVKTKESTEEKGSEWYGVMYGAQKANCPMYFIFEHSFHTNKKAALWLLEDENLKNLAEIEAEIIADWYGLQPKFLLGDVNGNGAIDSMDYMLAKKIYLGKYNPTDEELKRCDIDKDGKISAMDYLLIKRAYFGAYTPDNSNENEAEPVYKIGDKVKIKESCTKYSNGKNIKSWVKDSVLYVRNIENNGDILLLSTKASGDEYTGRVYAKDVYKVS